MKSNDRVLINMPLYGGGVTKPALRRVYNHKIAVITEVLSDGCRLNIDGGKYIWPKSVLARHVAIR